MILWVASGPFDQATNDSFPPITDDLEASVPPPPKSGPSQDAVAAISRFTRCTVPVPTPSALAVLRIPAPVTSSVRIRSTTSALTGRRPSRFPCARARERPRLTLAANDRPLELGECARYLEQQAACRRRGVDVLLIQVKVDPNRFQVLDRAKKVAERTPNPIYRPCHDEIEPTPIGVLEHPIERWAFIAAFSAADPEILIDLCNRPSATLGDPFQFETLVLCVLAARAGA